MIKKVFIIFIFTLFINQSIAEENIMILKLKDGNVKIQLFNDMFTSTIDVFFLSKTIFKLVKLNAKGILNIGAKNCISKKDFAIYFSKFIGKKIRYEEISVKKLKPHRGKCMCLNINKVEKRLGIKMINSKQVIRNLVNQI